jgi:uncharacterized protein YecE (DUF72 family)
MTEAPKNSSNFYNLEKALALPAQLRFGCSSWVYPGWKGLVYKRHYKSEAEFKRECLAEYAAHPLFRSVGIDSFYYSPPKSKALQLYSQQVGPNFKWISKVWERITITHYPSHPRYGAFAGKKNPDFLNADLFISQVLEPCTNPEIRPHVGPFVFQFSPFGRKVLSQINFQGQLDNFLGKLPKDFQYAVELRDPELLSPEYFTTLNRHGATHCFSHWNFMPPLHEQMRAAATVGGLSAPFYVARLLTPLGLNYSEAVEAFQPYTQIQAPNQQMRKDTLRLAKRALERGFDAYVIVNNRSEGCSPMTIADLVEQLA